MQTTKGETVKNSLPAIALLLDSARGTFIPNNFVECFDMTKWKGISGKQIGILLEKDHEYYDETWSDVLGSATYTENGHTWSLYQDGDLWAICYELMSNEERQNFGFDDDVESE